MTITDWWVTVANKPGRLYRKLDWLPKPLFRVHSSTTGERDDDTIRSISIHRGKSDPGGGISPSTCEVEYSDYAVGKAGETLTVEVASAAAATLGSRVGQGAGGVAPRFKGRVGKQSVIDRGAYRRQSTLFGASWTAQLSTSPKTYSFAPGTSIGTLLSTILKPSHLPQIATATQGTFDRTWDAITDETYSDLIGKFSADIGILIRDSRFGRTDILPMPYRRDDALAKVATSPPLVRSQALSPAEWEQPNEISPVVYRLKRRDVNGNETIEITSPGGTIDGTEPVQDLDWTYFREYTDQWFYIHAMRSQGFDDRFRISKITIDLLQLLSSERLYDRQQAGRLLILNPGDPVYFSGDWPGGLRGIHFAEGITERIDSNTWEIDLELVNFRETTGQNPPAIPARVWESATYPWNDETRKWDEV